MDNYQNLSESDCQWLDLIRQCRASGKTDCQWLEENNIKPSAFYRNIRKLKAKSCEIPKSGKRRNPETNEVVPWIIDDSTNQFDAHTDTHDDVAVRLSVNGIRVEISNNATHAIIQNTLSALQSLC